jgi:hypothetical protein
MISTDIVKKTLKPTDELKSFLLMNGDNHLNLTNMEGVSEFLEKDYYLKLLTEVLEKGLSSGYTQDELNKIQEIKITLIKCKKDYVSIRKMI